MNRSRVQSSASGVAGGDRAAGGAERDRGGAGRRAAAGRASPEETLSSAVARRTRRPRDSWLRTRLAPGRSGDGIPLRRLGRNRSGAIAGIAGDPCAAPSELGCRAAGPVPCCLPDDRQGRERRDRKIIVASASSRTPAAETALSAMGRPPAPPTFAGTAGVPRRPRQAALCLISIFFCRAAASAVFGRVTVSTPFSNLASIRSRSTPCGSGNERRKEPKRRSER